MGRRTLCNSPGLRRYVTDTVRTFTRYPSLPIGFDYLTSSQVIKFMQNRTDPGRLLEGHSKASIRREVERALAELAEEGKIESTTVCLGNSDVILYSLNRPRLDMNDSGVRAVSDALKSRRDGRYFGPEEITRMACETEPGLTTDKVRGILSKLDEKGLLETVSWERGHHYRFAFRMDPDRDDPETIRVKRIDRSKQEDPFNDHRDYDIDYDGVYNTKDGRNLIYKTGPKTRPSWAPREVVPITHCYEVLNPMDESEDALLRPVTDPMLLVEVFMKIDETIYIAEQ